MNHQRKSATQEQHDRCFPGLRDESGWRIQSRVMYEHLAQRGLYEKGRLQDPMFGFKWLQIGRTWVKVLSREEAVARARQLGLSTRKTHRVLARCECCQREIPFGRTHQHAKVH